MFQLKNYLFLQSFKLMVVSFFGRVFGLLRDVVYSFVFGTSALFSHFVIVFTFPNFFRRIFGEGSLASSLIPIFSDLYQESKEKAWEFFNTASLYILLRFFIFCLFVSVVCAVFAIFSTGLIREGLIFTSILFPYAVCICFSGLLAVVLNFKKVFFLPALSFVFLNFFLIGASLIAYSFRVAESSQGIYILISSVWISGILQFLILFFYLKRKFGMTWRWFLREDRKGIAKLKEVFYPSAFSHLASQLGVLFDRFLAPLVGTYAAASLYYAERVMAFSIGVFAIPLSTVSLPLKSSFSSTKQDKGVIRIFFLGVRQLLVFVFPCLLFFSLYGEEILRTFFVHGAFDEKSLGYTLSAYYCYLPSAFAFSLTYLLRPIFYVKKSTYISLKVDWACLLVNISLGLLLMPILAHNALALSTTFSAFLRMIFLFFLCPLNLWAGLKKELVPIVRIFFCSLVASLLVFVYFPPNYFLSIGGAIFHLAFIAFCIFLLTIILIFIFRGKELQFFLKFFLRGIKK